MRVLVASLAGGSGGDYVAALDLAKALREHGTNVTFAHVVSQELWQAHREITVGKAAARGFDLIHGCSWKDLSSKIHFADFDLVHIHTGSVFAGRVEYLAARLALGRKPMVWTLHGPLDTFQTLRENKVWMIKWVARQIQAAIVPSLHKKLEWDQARVYEGKLHHIPYVFPDQHRMEKPEARRQLGIPLDATVFLFAGIFRPIKRPLDFVYGAKVAAETLPNVHLLFAGIGELEDDLRAAVAEAGIPATFLGYVNNVVPAYSASDVFCLPSEHDNFPLAMFDAAILETPIAATRIPVVNLELTQMGRAATFDVGDTQGLGAALCEATSIGCRELKDMRDAVLAHCGATEVAEKHVHLYRQILNQA